MTHIAAPARGSYGHRVKFGIVLDDQFDKGDDFGRRFDELVRVTETARDLGFESAFCVHHYLASLATPQPMALLARLIPHSGTMQLGTGVYLATVEHPVRLAENAATLDQLSGGRLVLGLGAGYRHGEFETFGIDRSTRWSRLAETVTLLEELWSGEPVDHQGEHFSIKGQTIGIVPKQSRPPIWVGANGPDTVRRAAHIGDTWLAPPNVKANWAKGNLAAFRDELAAQGRAVEGRTYPIQRELYVADSDAAAQAEAVPYIEREYATLASYDLAHFDTMFDDLREKAFLFGSAATVAERIADLAAAGFDHFIFRISWSAMPLELTLASLARFASEVMPQFRSAA